MDRATRSCMLCTEDIRGDATLIISLLNEATCLATDEADVEEEDRTSSEPKIAGDTKQQKAYDHCRQQRDALLHEQNLAVPPQDSQPYESDFSQTRKIMPECDRLATNLFPEGSLRDKVGHTVMNDLIALCRSNAPTTYFSGLNVPGLQCRTCRRESGSDNEHNWWAHLYRC